MYQAFKDVFNHKTFLEMDRQGSPATKKLKLAVTILLWNMAKVDDSRSEDETLEVIRLIDHEFHLRDEDTGELLEAAEVLRHHHDHIENAIAEINVSYDTEQREHLIDMLVEVAKVDNYIDPDERDFINYLREKLNLTVIG